MTFKVKPKQAAKIVKSVRLTPEAVEILNDMVEAYNSTPAFCIEGLLMAFGPGAIKEANAIKSKKNPRKRGTGRRR